MPDLSLAEAASTLGISVETVRRRIKRGQLASHHDAEGHVLVTVPGSDGQMAVNGLADARQDDRQRQADASQDAAASVFHRELVDALKAHIADLQQRLDASEQAEAELRRLLGMALQRPTLPAPEPTSHDVRLPRPWWRRLWRW
jgi:hypothetical protein